MSKENPTYPFASSVEGVRYKTDEELENGVLKAMDNFYCPTCPKDPSRGSETIGFSPIQMSYDKYPSSEMDVAYLWEQQQKCSTCGTIFWIENGT